MSKMMKTNNRNTIKYLILFVIFVALSFALILSFNNITKNDIKAVSLEKQNERITGGAYVVKNEIDAYKLLLATFSRNITETGDLSTKNNIMKLLNQVLENSKFDNAYYIDKEGYLMNEVGDIEKVSDRDYFISAMKGVPYIQKIVGKIVHEPRIIIAVPVYGNDGVVGVLAGSYSEENFNQIIRAATSSNEGIYLIIQGNGEYVSGYTTYDETTLTKVREQNFFDLIKENGGKQDKEEINKLIASISGKESASVETTLFGEPYYLSYTFVNVESWMLISFVSTTYTDEFADIVTRNTYISLLALIVIFTAILLFIVFSDRSNLKRIDEDKENLRISEERYKIVEKMSDSVIFECDYLTNKVTFTDNFFNMFHRAPDIVNAQEFLGDNATYSHLHPDDREKTREFVRNMKNELVGYFEYRKIEKDGIYHWYKMRYAVIFSSTGEKVKVIGKIINIDQQKKETLELIDKADKDSLTQIFNHETFKRKTIEYLMEKKHSERCALLMLDIDNFKVINDTYGHMEGDKELQKTAEMLKSIFRTTDIIGRIGGDEFAVLMKGVKDEKEACQKAAEIVSIAKEKRKMGRKEGTISVGVSITDEVINNFDELYKSSDTALYEAKMLGKDRYSLFKKV